MNMGAHDWRNIPPDGAPAECTQHTTGDAIQVEILTLIQPWLQPEERWLWATMTVRWSDHFTMAEQSPIVTTEALASTAAGHSGAGHYAARAVTVR
jgi:hypothetical protein